MNDGADDRYSLDGYKWCGLIEMYESEPQNTSAAFVRDGSGFYAVLCVMEEFGCNQWASK